jgi:2,4-diketo-3-deoxy-L-fuconate hydrolase
MRIGQPGDEMPVVRINDDEYVDVSDVIPDFNEAFFAGGMEQPPASFGGSPVNA